MGYLLNALFGNKMLLPISATFAVLLQLPCLATKDETKFVCFDINNPSTIVNAYTGRVQMSNFFFSP